jgi:hypothetical protein
MLRGDDDDRLLLFALLCVCVAVVFWSLFQPSSGNKAPSKVRETFKDEEAEQNRKTFCGEITRSCKVVKEAKLTDCRPAEARRRMRAIVGDAMSSEDCQRVRQELEESCPDGCLFDYSSMIVVPGRLALDLDPAKDESGKCLVSGQKDVSIRGRCVRPGS